MLRTILSIAGKPGLYRLLSQGRNMLIVEALDSTKKRMPVYASDKVTSLSDISTKMETHYLRKYNFDVYEEALKDEIEETNEDYFG